MNNAYLGAADDGNDSKGDESRVQAIHNMHNRGFLRRVADHIRISRLDPT